MLNNTEKAYLRFIKNNLASLRRGLKTTEEISRENGGYRTAINDMNQLTETITYISVYTSHVLYGTEKQQQDNMRELEKLFEKL